MITLITGTPGAGKTLYAVSELLGGEYAGRPLYVDGIPELLLDHEIAQDPLEWHDWIPAGKDAVLVVDECQRVWRPRHYGKDVPPSVAAFETHRHMGVDVVLITQHPNLLDSNVRRLVGRHIHVRRLWGMNRTMVYEWDSATDPQRTSTAISRSWSYPKKAFNWYKSATAHTARKNRMPVAVFLFIAAMIGVPLAGYAGYTALFDRFDGDPSVQPDAANSPDTASWGASPPHLPYQDNAVDAVSWDSDKFLPRDPLYPESAPAYDHLAEVKTFPQVAGCIAGEKRGCQCYTQQGSRVWLPERECLDRVESHPFNPYRENPAPVSVPTSPPVLPLSDGYVPPPADAEYPEV